MTKKEMMLLQKNDIIVCPFNNDLWIVEEWKYDREEGEYILIVHSINNTFKWFLKEYQLRRYTIYKNKD